MEKESREQGTQDSNEDKRELHIDLKEDFEEFWDFWSALHDYALEIVEPDTDGTRSLGDPNTMMVAAYAAAAWFWKKHSRYSFDCLWQKEDWHMEYIGEMRDKYEGRLEKFRAENRNLKQKLKRAEKAKATA